jgi:hypothetical protein
VRWDFIRRFVLARILRLDLLQALGQMAHHDFELRDLFLLLKYLVAKLEN